MANFKVPANISYSKGAEIEKNHNVYFAECEDRPRGKKISLSVVYKVLVY